MKLTPEPAVEPDRDPALLAVSDLRVGYTDTDDRTVWATDGASLSLHAGEVVAVVGESGSGKTTLAHSIIGLLPPSARIDSGSISFGGENLRAAGPRRLQALRGAEIGFIPQDPTVSLNPVQRIGDQVAEVLRIHHIGTRGDRAARAIELLADAGLDRPAARAQQFPHELSGGMRQRVLIAIAVAARPRMIIADEPTSALDVTVQRQILDHIGELTAQHGIAMLLITHDLGVAADRADRLVVMSGGRVVEHGATSQILTAARDPYTRRLLSDAPSMATPSRRPAVIGPELLRVDKLRKTFPLPRTAGAAAEVVAVDDVSFSIARGSTFGLVGESGSGKSTTARMVLGLEQPTSGLVQLDGVDVSTLSGGSRRELRRRVQFVYQNPYTSLDPRMRIGEIVAEPLRAFAVGDKAERSKRVVDLLDDVGLPADYARRRPSELSGGQRQRVAIARALALQPELVVLDEPVSALDVTVQAQVLTLLGDLQSEHQLSYLFISHDLAVVHQISDEVGVMSAGRLVESGPVAQIFDDPHHEYTAELLAAIPGRSAPGVLHRSRLSPPLSKGTP